MITECDLHSVYIEGQPRMKHVSWEIAVQFETKTLHAIATITFDSAGEVTLDTRDLLIEDIQTKTGVTLPFILGEKHPLLGSSLTFTVPEDTEVRIVYSTIPEATGLQWLAKEHTDSKNHPFLFSQGEAIHARSYIPCQDSPGIRFTFDGTITVPKALRGLMAAPIHNGRVEHADTATEKWSMPYPIPAYLLAFAVGELEQRTLSDRTGVWAEPSMIDRAAKEFEDLPTMLEEADKLFGPYLWNTYSVLVMPSSFPYGGMENPCLSFVTPSLVVGDKSATWVVIHELAHSWTGNLVTNETWRDFWLNEGWTEYAQDRIMEKVFSKDESTVVLRLLEREFGRDLQNFNSHPLFTCLAPDLTDVDPDDNFSRVPYFMGSMFLRRIEEEVGRERFDPVIQKYIAEFKFKSITTARFLSFIARELPGVLEDVRAWEWVYEAGMPHDAPILTSPGIIEVESFAAKAEVPPKGTVWRSGEMQLYLEMLPRPMPIEQVARIDSYFNLSTVLDIELRWSYLMLALESHYMEILPHIEAFLMTQGRMRYLKPMYQALTKTAEGLSFARRVFTAARPGYHPIAATQIERMLAKT